MGYARVGFDIVGIDIVPQPDYPFDFVQADALEPPVDLDTFDLIHASPPCQAFSTMGNRWRNPRSPALIDTTRRLLETARVPYVIENVPGAVSALHNPIRLTGGSFDLAVNRPRLFELGGWYTLAPPPTRPERQPVGVYGKPDGRRLWDRADGTVYRAWSSVEQGARLLEVPWMTDPSAIAESIPPVYTEWIGRQFLDQIGHGPTETAVTGDSQRYGLVIR
jgi:DNA (cytosine-5)-methyltransferase 1